MSSEGGGGIFPPQSQYTTTSSFATSAWSHRLQHKHNIQETSPTARIISPCNTTRLLCSGSALPLRSLHSKLECALARHPLQVDNRSDPWIVSVFFHLQRLRPSNTDLLASNRASWQLGPPSWTRGWFRAEWKVTAASSGVLCVCILII